MLRSITDLRGFSLGAIDGTIGKVDDFHFDDVDWGIRYLIVDTGSWLSGRRVLISPVAVGHAGWMARRLPVALTRAQVEHSPDIDTRKPVSRLRSSRAVIGHHIRATDGDIGHLDDLLVDDSWAIRYLVVNTSGWWGGHRVLVSPEWIIDVSWPEASVSVDLTRLTVKDAPPYSSAAEFNRQLEQALYEHYDRPGYWTTSTASP